MTSDQFWYEDIDLFYAYQKAYQRRTNYSAWLNGLYIQRAIDSAIYNTMPHAISVGLNGSKDRPVYNYFAEPIDFERVVSKQVEETQKQETTESIFTEDGYMEALVRLNKLK